MRFIFDINNLNLTEFARAFGLYKDLAQKITIATKHHAAAEKKEKKESKKRNFTPRDAPAAALPAASLNVQHQI